MERPFPTTFDEILPECTQTAAAKVPYKPNVSRQKTKKWVEAKPVNYDGDDWGYRNDECNPPKPPSKQEGLRQRNQTPEYPGRSESIRTDIRSPQTHAKSVDVDYGKQKPSRISVPESTIPITDAPPTFVPQSTGTPIDRDSSDSTSPSTSKLPPLVFEKTNKASASLTARIKSPTSLGDLQEQPVHSPLSAVKTPHSIHALPLVKAGNLSSASCGSPTQSSDLSQDSTSVSKPSSCTGERSVASGPSAPPKLSDTMIAIQKRSSSFLKSLEIYRKLEDEGMSGEQQPMDPLVSKFNGMVPRSVESLVQGSASCSTRPGTIRSLTAKKPNVIIGEESSEQQKLPEGESNDIISVSIMNPRSPPDAVISEATLADEPAELGENLSVHNPSRLLKSDDSILPDQGFCENIVCERQLSQRSTAAQSRAASIKTQSPVVESNLTPYPCGKIAPTSDANIFHSGSAQVPNHGIEYGISIIKNPISSETDDIDNQNEQMSSEIVQNISARHSDGVTDSPCLTLESSNVGGEGHENLCLPTECHNYQDSTQNSFWSDTEINGIFPHDTQKQDENSALAASENYFPSMPDTIFIAPLSPRRSSLVPFTSRRLVQTQIPRESDTEGISEVDGLPGHVLDYLKEVPRGSVDHSVSPRKSVIQSGQGDLELSAPKDFTATSPTLSPSKPGHPPSDGCIVDDSGLVTESGVSDFAILAADINQQEENLIQPFSSVDQNDPLVSSISVSSSPSTSEFPAESLPQALRTDKESYLPALNKVSSFVPPGSPFALNTNAQGFREILALKSPQDRKRNFDESREKFATIESGINNWIRQVKSQYPEYENVTAYFPGPRSSVSSGYGSTRPKFAKVAGSPPFFQPPHNQQFLNTSSNSAPPTSNFRHGLVSSVPSSQQNPLTGNKQTSHQVQARGKEFFHTAGVIGGKASKAGKGLLVKGRNRLRAAGGGDKETENPPTTRTKPVRRASWSLPLIINRISGKRDSSLHETTKIDPKSTPDLQSILRTRQSPDSTQTSSTKVPSLSDRNLAPLRPLNLRRTFEANSSIPKFDVTQGTKYAAIGDTNGPSSVSNNSRSVLGGSGERIQAKNKRLRLAKISTQFVSPHESGKVASSTEGSVELRGLGKHDLPDSQKLIEKSSRNVDIVTSSPRGIATHRRGQSQIALNFSHMTQTSKNSELKQTMQTEGVTVKFEPQPIEKPSKPPNTDTSNYLQSNFHNTSLGYLPVIPPLSLPSKDIFSGTPFSTSEPQHEPPQQLYPWYNALEKPGLIRRSIFEGLSSQDAEREKIEFSASFRRNSKLEIDFDKTQKQGDQNNSEECSQNHNPLQAYRRKSSLDNGTNKWGLKTIRASDVNHSSQDDSYFQHPRDLFDRQIQRNSQVPSSIIVSPSVSTDFHDTGQTGAHEDNGKLTIVSSNLSRKQSQPDQHPKRPEISIIIPQKPFLKKRESTRSRNSYERKNRFQSGSGSDHPLTGIRFSDQPPSSAQRYPELFRTEQVTTEIVEKDAGDFLSQNYQVSLEEKSNSVSKPQTHGNLILDPAGPERSHFVTRRNSKSSNKFLKEIGGRLHISRNKHSSGSRNNAPGQAKDINSYFNGQSESLITPGTSLDVKKGHRDSLSSDQKHKFTFKSDSTFLTRPRASASHHQSSQASNSSAPLTSKVHCPSYRSSSPAGYQHRPSDQCDPKVQDNDPASTYGMRSVAELGARGRFHAQRSYSEQESRGTVPKTPAFSDNKAEGIVSRRFSGTGLLNGFLSRLIDKTDEPTDYLHGRRSQDTQKIAGSRQKKSLDHSSTQANEAKFCSILPQLPYQNYTQPPDQLAFRSQIQTIDPFVKFSHVSDKVENRNLSGQMTSRQLSISPVSSMSSLRDSEIGTFFTTSSSIRGRPALSGTQGTLADNESLGRCLDPKASHFDFRLNEEFNSFQTGYDLTRIPQECTIPETISFPSQSFSLQTSSQTDQKNNKHGETQSNDNSDHPIELDSHQTGITMSATSYPRQEWNPFVAGA